MTHIRIITGYPDNPEHRLRTLEDLLPYEREGLQISLSHNIIGSIHTQSDIEHELAKPGLARCAVQAELEGVDAIVIESMGDTGLRACREAVTIPVIGMSDTGMRVACMLGRKFGLITAGDWHGYALEQLAILYGTYNQLAGFKSLNLQPFFTDIDSSEHLKSLIVEAAVYLIEHKDADVILFGGSYFLGCNTYLNQILKSKGYDATVIDPLPLAINFAKTLADSKLSQSKKIYQTPTHITKIIGYEQFNDTKELLNY